MIKDAASAAASASLVDRLLRGAWSFVTDAR
jgi:hypothetical protein